jgi:acetyl esterase
MTFPIGPTGSVPVRIIRPRELPASPPVVIYCHGGGWIAGDTETHDRLIREIAVGAGAALVFVCYDLAPEARFPIAIEQVYAATLHVVSNASALNLDATRIAVIGDCAGGAIAASVTILARERRGPKIDVQILICPVTAADFDTPSYERFATGPWLTRAAMSRAWDCWLPDVARRNEVLAAPLRAALDQLAHLPAALIIAAENDVTRDEAECYGRRLSDAGVRVTSVRYNGTIHDFAVLNALADTPAARGAIFQITDTLRQTFGWNAGRFVQDCPLSSDD